ncbi:mechanosensitive ion channel [Amylibacter sp. SFDW26]|uniref:mechanosensitive ion channel family protein n=1 Tax=Amylibacter sp. SFDW26 TaxID=2652722 RepID=UPI0012624B5A|nr:mechanosensitive ion channel domain-containing protein [Amylibacter sp. SFDW26]KAB7616173.1 mechanosensitive ion channel [Amylibacter sp. SFDW26]
MFNSINSVGGWFAANTVNILYAVAIILIAIWASNFIKKLIVGMGENYEKLDETLFHFLGSIARYAVLAFAGIAVLNRFGIETTSLIALIGAAGLAVGLALQGTLSNLAAGVMLLMFRPYKVGDFVQAADTFGKVDAITLFTTDMITFDNQHIIVPNASIWGAKITNHSHHNIRGVDMVASVAYGTDIKKAKASIAKVLKANKNVLADPAPFVEVETLAASSVDLLVRPFCEGEHYFDVKYSLPQAIYEQFQKDGIEIPFQQIVVHNAK